MNSLLFVCLDRVKKTRNFIYVFNLFTFLFVILPFFIVLYYAFTPAPTVSSNATFVSIDVFRAILRSLFVAFITVVIVFLLSYPFAYMTSNLESLTAKSIVIAFITSPLWSSFFVKLIGLKSFFDLVNGDLNSTYGLMYVIIGLVYMNIPIAVINFFGVLNNIPKNLVNAVLDLGNNRFEAIYKVVIPYTKESIFSVIFLVFLPSFTAITVADFLNHENSSKLIGQLMNNYVGTENTSDLAKSRISFLTLCICLVVFILYLLIKIFPNLLRKFWK